MDLTVAIPELNIAIPLGMQEAQRHLDVQDKSSLVARVKDQAIPARGLPTRRKFIRVHRLCAWGKPCHKIIPTA